MSIRDSIRDPFHRPRDMYIEGVAPSPGTREFFPGSDIFAEVAVVSFLTFSAARWALSKQRRFENKKRIEHDYTKHGVQISATFYEQTTGELWVETVDMINNEHLVRLGVDHLIDKAASTTTKENIILKFRTVAERRAAMQFISNQDSAATGADRRKNIGRQAHGEPLIRVLLICALTCDPESRHRRVRALQFTADFLENVLKERSGYDSDEQFEQALIEGSTKMPFLFDAHRDDHRRVMAALQIARRWKEGDAECDGIYRTSITIAKEELSNSGDEFSSNAYLNAMHQTGTVFFPSKKHDYSAVDPVLLPARTLQPGEVESIADYKQRKAAALKRDFSPLLFPDVPAEMHQWASLPVWGHNFTETLALFRRSNNRNMPVQVLMQSVVSGTDSKELLRLPSGFVQPGDEGSNAAIRNFVDQIHQGAVLKDNLVQNRIDALHRQQLYPVAVGPVQPEHDKRIFVKDGRCLQSIHDRCVGVNISSKDDAFSWINNLETEYVPPETSQNGEQVLGYRWIHLSALADIAQSHNLTIAPHHLGYLIASGRTFSDAMRKIPARRQ